MPQPTIIPDIIGPQELAWIRPDTTIRDAARMMLGRHVAAVLVMDGDVLKGVLTERDIAAKVVAAGLNPDITQAGAVMTGNPDTIAPDAAPSEALDMMRVRGYRHLPVVADGKVLGMISVRDLYSPIKEKLEADLKRSNTYIFGALPSETGA